MDSYKRSKEPEGISLKCAAYGCTLTGALCFHGKSQGYCRYHFRQDVKDFDEISTRIRKAAPLRNHIRALKENPWSTHLYVYPKPEFNKTEEENPFQYAYRLEHYMDCWIKDGIEPGETLEMSMNAGDISAQVVNSITETQQPN